MSLVVSAGLVVPVQPALAEGEAGAYLAARAADLAGDHRAAAQWYVRALAADPANPRLLDAALRVHLGLGKLEQAAGFAELLVDMGRTSQLGQLVLAAEAARIGEWRTIFTHLEEGRAVSPLIDGLSQGWALVGTGEVTRALSTFGEVAETRGLRPFGLYHKALALALAGDMEGADAILSLPPDQGLQRTRRAVIAHAEVLSQLGRNADAVQLLQDTFGADLDAGLRDMANRLEAGEPMPFTFITSPEEGLAEVFFTVAGTIAGEAPEELVLMYLQLAHALNPDDAEIILMMAGLLDRMERHQLAVETFNRVPTTSPMFAMAEIGRADALRRGGEAETAVEVLSQLLRNDPGNGAAHVRLGDVLRSLERFEAAREAYGTALTLFDGDDPARWFIHFTRAIASHMLDDWPQTEADLRAALAINPDQPQVLNYLGYSLVERHENMDEALDMIERAVAGDPDNGAIVDSLGWVFFRLGRFDEAVEQLERAVELLPTDPIINDHLGDAYWAVGRKREARFQWSRALSFDPEEDETARIRRKLEVGLDQVLIEEGAEPLSVAHDGR
ncbi:MAG: tetratricopeptide repeat protein [Rubellimicrobium sp.]|nr:tetratricopeptide repeat protein [Rubellimicrobium sp.]